MDLKALSESLGLEEDEFKEIVEIFVSTADSDIEKLLNAHANNDCEAASEAAHSLKGSAGNLGFTELSDISATLETNARNNDINDLEAALPVLTEKLNEIKKSITS